MHGEADAAGTLRDQGALFERVVYSLYAVIRHCQKEATKKAITPLNSSSMCLQRVDFWVCSAHCLLVVLLRSLLRWWAPMCLCRSTVNCAPTLCEEGILRGMSANKIGPLQKN